MNKIRPLTLTVLGAWLLVSLELQAQQEETIGGIGGTGSQEEGGIIGGIGGTGMRDMERPEMLERPELLDSREALDDLIEAGDINEAVDLDRPSSDDLPETQTP